MVRMHLKAARVNANLTQKDVCKKLGIYPSTLISWEKENTFPSVAQFKVLCNLYGCDIMEASDIRGREPDMAVQADGNPAPDNDAVQEVPGHYPA